jgi:HSP20 family molecular chaperone IbpA
MIKWYNTEYLPKTYEIIKGQAKEIIKETKDSYTISLSLPGFSKKDILVKVSEQGIDLKAEKKVQIKKKTKKHL